MSGEATETKSGEVKGAEEMGQSTTEARSTVREIRVGIVGVGNCAASLVSGVAAYGRGDVDGDVGLRRVQIGGYAPGDIRPVVAWDVDDAKVGRSLGVALRAGRNCARVGSLWEYGDAPVRAGPVMDGIGRSYRDAIDLAGSPPTPSVARFANEVRDAGVDVLVNYLPVGSEQATRFWASVALEARVAFVNCIPVFIASDDEWAEAFDDRGLPLIGDDVKSQLGATVAHRALARLFRERGMRLDRTYQLNVGGNMDFVNLMDGDRIATKRESKTGAVRSEAPHLGPDDVHISPSAHVPWLGDRKWAYIRAEGRGWQGARVAIEMKMEVEDSPNSAGVVVDAIRCAALARDAGVGGALTAPATVLMKSPPGNAPDDSRADEVLDAWIESTAHRVGEGDADR